MRTKRTCLATQIVQSTWPSVVLIAVNTKLTSSPGPEQPYLSAFLEFTRIMGRWASVGRPLSSSSVRNLLSGRICTKPTKTQFLLLLTLFLSSFNWIAYVNAHVCFALIFHWINEIRLLAAGLMELVQMPLNNGMVCFPKQESHPNTWRP